jgi:hypothetical protein
MSNKAVSLALSSHLGHLSTLVSPLRKRDIETNKYVKKINLLVVK